VLPELAGRSGPVVSGERGSVAKRSAGVCRSGSLGDRAAAVLGEQLRRVSLRSTCQLPGARFLARDLVDPSQQSFGTLICAPSRVLQGGERLFGNARPDKAAGAQAGSSAGRSEQMPAQRVCHLVAQRRAVRYR